MSSDAKNASESKMWTTAEMTKMLDEIHTNVTRLHELIECAPKAPKNQRCTACTRQQQENAKDITLLFTVLETSNTDEFNRAKKAFRERLQSLKESNTVPAAIVMPMPGDSQ